MKMEEAMRIMEGPPKGFMVAFERLEGSILASDHFPDVRNGEPPNPPKIGARTVWVCGKMRGKDDAGNPAWDLQGVFDTETAAEAACNSLNDFIGPVSLNQVLPQGATEWPNCRYPLAR